MSYAATAPTDPADPDFHPTIDPPLAELRGRITERTGHLGEAADSLADIVLELVMELYDNDGRDTKGPGEVVGFIDEAASILHEIRVRAVQENRQRLDAAMDRSAKLLGGDAR